MSIVNKKEIARIMYRKGKVWGEIEKVLKISSKEMEQIGKEIVEEEYQEEAKRRISIS